MDSGESPSRREAYERTVARVVRHNEEHGSKLTEADARQFVGEVARGVDMRRHECPPANTTAPVVEDHAVAHIPVTRRRE